MGDHLIGGQDILTYTKTSKQREWDVDTSNASSGHISSEGDNWHPHSARTSAKRRGTGPNKI
jgi:hypothetical protein